ncbi:MAG: hypothetical protein JW735_02820 [Prolixibacteraceae bacterium]|jgi:hypothetical protein|nr:hypothetical protein [Prolixibacteraceae bacterium]
MTAWQEDEGEIKAKVEIEVIMPQMVQRTEIFVAISKTLNLQRCSAPKYLVEVEPRYRWRLRKRYSAPKRWSRLME